MNKKKLLSLALVVLLICTISFGTLAWFNDKDDVTNTFHVASSNNSADADSIFSVDVWEYVDGNTTEKDQDGAKFTNILPGSRLRKEVHIENTGAYDQYIRVNVSLTEATAFTAALESGTDLTRFFEDFDSTAWTRYDEPRTVDDTLTYTYYLNYKLEPGKDACLFTTVVIPTELTQQDMAAMEGNFALTVVAEAVQADNLGVNGAKAAFDLVERNVGENYGE